jgi:arylsulfatase A-like enzyme
MPPGITDIEWVTAAYDGSLAYMDACIRRIFTRLEELGLYENTLIVITSDHGETLNDHGIYFDHHGLYDPTLHVPLIYHLPGTIPAGRRVEEYALQQDLTPTVLELMGYGDIPGKLGMDGKSVVPNINGQHQVNYSEFYVSECTWMRKRGWRTPQYKYIEAMEPDFHNKPPIELYDLIKDPLENENIAEREPETVAALKARMEKWVKMRLEQTGKPDPILGYEIGLDRRIGSVRRAKDLQAQKDK